MSDIKRIKRHTNTSDTLSCHPNMIVPKAQLESIPGVYSGEAVNFRMFTQ